MPRRSTLSDANARRSEKFFEEVYRNLYNANKYIPSSDSRRGGTEEWIKRLPIIDSTTVSLFSNAIFKGVGRHPRTDKKKGDIKVHTVISPKFMESHRPGYDMDNNTKKRVSHLPVQHSS